MPNSVNRHRNTPSGRPAQQQRQRTSARRQHAQLPSSAAARSRSAQRQRSAQPARQQQRSNAKRTKASARTPQRTSVSRAVKRQHAKQRAKAYGPSGRSRIIFTVVMVMVLAVIAVAVAVNQASESKYASCEKWRSTVMNACKATSLDTDWTNAIIAAMVVESGGDTGVESVTGARGDIMQAAEGAYGDIVKNGSTEYGVKANTPEASIYAGVLEFKQNLNRWDSYLGGISPTDSAKIQLVIQGYNFGSEGWFQWCEDQHITEYTVEAAQRYSDTKMPENAKGTPTHGQKWLTAYKRVIADYSA